MAHQNFTDHPVQPNVTRVRLTHILELSSAINEWHQYYRLPEPVNITVDINTLVRSDDINALKNDINSLSANHTPEGEPPCGTTSYSCENVPCAALNVWGSVTPVTTGDLIKALDMQTFVNNVTTAQHLYCSNCDIRTTADSFKGCQGCDTSCNGYVACICDGTCNSGYSCSCDSRCHNYCCGCHWEGSGDGTCSPCIQTTNLCGCAGCNPPSCVLPGTTISHYVVGCTSDGSVGCQGCDTSCNSFQCQSCYSQYYRYPWDRVESTYTYYASANGRIYSVTEGIKTKIEDTKWVGSVTEDVSAIAFPASAYTFDTWSDTLTSYTRSDIIASNTSVSAIFLLNQYDVNYTYNESNGFVEGDTIQSVYHYGNAIPVTAFPTPISAYELFTWSDGITASTTFIDDPISGLYGIRLDENITQSICAIPIFTTKKVTLNYYASTGGTIILSDFGTIIESNPTIQSVVIYSSAVEISAIPISPFDYYFNNWSDGYPAITGTDPISGIYGIRQDINITEPFTVSAIFLSGV